MQSAHDTHPSIGQDSTVPNDSRLVWESPRLEKLNVSLDTAFLPGSNSDGLTQTAGSPP